MRKKILLLVAVFMLFNSCITAYAVEYANFVYKKKFALRVYDAGQVDLIYKNKKYRLADDGRCRFAGIDKNGTIYLLIINDCLYGFDYRKQKKVELVKLEKEVKTVKTTKYGYVYKYKKYNGKTYKLTKKKKKKLWKKAMKNSHN